MTDPRELAQRIFAGIRPCLAAHSHTQKGNWIVFIVLILLGSLLPASITIYAQAQTIRSLRQQLSQQREGRK